MYNIGDRVKSKLDGDVSMNEWYSGKIIQIIKDELETTVFIMRDDGEKGSGPKGSWKCNMLSNNKNSIQLLDQDWDPEENNDN